MNKHDLTNEITVFLLTCGEETTGQAWQALDNQTVKFKLKLIEDVSPISAAFQQQLDRCKTPYYIQVDSDMILDTNAIEVLYMNIKRLPSNLFMYCRPLRDTFLNLAIVGVKIFKHDIAELFPFKDVLGCEMVQLSEAIADGYEYMTDGELLENLDDTIGEHVSSGDPMKIFDRFHGLGRRRSMSGQQMGWLDRCFPQWLERYRNDNDMDLFAAISGFIIGIGCSESGSKRPYHKNAATWHILKEILRELT